MIGVQIMEPYCRNIQKQNRLMFTWLTTFSFPSNRSSSENRSGGPVVYSLCDLPQVAAAESLCCQWNMVTIGLNRTVWQLTDSGGYVSE